MSTELRSTSFFAVAAVCSCLSLSVHAGAPGQHLVAHYALDTGSGSIAYDESPNQFDGQIALASWQPGIVGDYSLQFTGEGRAGFSDAEPVDTIGSLAHGTISLWFLYRGIPADQDIVPLLYFGEGDPDAPSNGVVIEIGHPFNEHLYFTILVDGSVVLCFDSRKNIILQTNRWYHFVAQVGPHGNRGFINGRLMQNPFYNAGTSDDSEFFASIPTQDIFTLGYGTTGITSFFQSHFGRIDDVRIYDRVLTAAEVRQLYQMHLN